MSTLTTLKRTQRKSFALPNDLYTRVANYAKKENMKLTQLIKTAIEEFLLRKEKEIMENEIIDACKFYYDIDKQLTNEWVIAEPKLDSEPR